MVDSDNYTTNEPWFFWAAFDEWFDALETQQRFHREAFSDKERAAAAICWAETYRIAAALPELPITKPF